MLGQAVVHPGHHSRKQALVIAGRQAVQTCIGVAGMLLAAAFIESYVRQSHMTTVERFLFAGGTALFWAAYITYGAVCEFRGRTVE